MNEKRVILVGGGTRSGKSRFALNLAEKLGEKRLFIATAQARDAEMAARIRQHQDSRGPTFVTLEEPLALPEALREIHGRDVVVIDCLTLWLANMLLGGTTSTAIHERVRDLGAALQRRTFHAVVVTNEVGMGIVPESSLGRLFRDVAGLAHQHLSQMADEVYFAVLGTMLRLKPHPEFIP
ncbi:MAG TPA: bifunctional adenosylcobinamide kinase/adenosylcobinamide-phosphate guanylyltransferase [Gemmataceae bacterium]|nr:bifunctional adenosylcobinamide kinase/adenosylcobinamide-phosphate guanylyltransferase [Gemmataceae bacterium]